MRAAALAVRQARPARIVVAVPVSAAETCDEFRDVVDEIVCGLTPRPFGAVGRFVLALLYPAHDQVGIAKEALAEGIAHGQSLQRQPCACQAFVVFRLMMFKFHGFSVFATRSNRVLFTLSQGIPQNYSQNVISPN